MRRIVGATTFILVGLLTGLAHGQAATDAPIPTKPRVFLQKYVARRATTLIETSVSAAVMRSEVNLRRGRVELGPLKDVTPEDAKK